MLKKLNLFKQILIISFIILSQNSIASKTDYRIKKLHYENSSDEKGLTTFEYDIYGTMHKAKWELLDGSRNSENYYTYDTKGNLIQKYREFSDGITSNLAYQYDENNNLINEVFERSDGVKGTVTYKYENNGKRFNASCNIVTACFHIIINYT